VRRLRLRRLPPLLLTTAPAGAANLLQAAVSLSFVSGPERRPPVVGGDDLVPVVHPWSLTMRTFWKWFVVLAVPAVWVTAARPAERLVPEGTTVQLILLRQKSVQQELALTPDKTKMVYDFTFKQLEAAQKAIGLGEAEAKKKFEQMEKENQQFLADTLTAAQSKRLDQITLQVTGLLQLTRPDVAKALNLTEEQQKKFAELQKENRKELEEIIHAKNKEGRNENLAKHRESTRTKIRALLTDEQKKKVEEIVGAPFKGEIVFEEP
jgi:hypothetical protein